MAQEINYKHSRWLNPYGPASYTNYGISVAPNPYNGAQAFAFAAAPIAVAPAPFAVAPAPFAVAGGWGRPQRAAFAAGEEQRRQAAFQNQVVGQLLRADRHQQKSGH